MTTEPDICQAYHGGNPQSVAAHDSLTDKQRTRQMVLECIKSFGIWGATCEEVEWHTGLKHQSVSARITELLEKSFIMAAPHTRRTTSGRTARVVVAL